jgi:hypothetical protein
MKRPGTGPINQPRATPWKHSSPTQQANYPWPSALHMDKGNAVENFGLPAYYASKLNNNHC